MTTLTATKAHQNFSDVLRKSIKGRARIKITSKSGVAVLMSKDHYESLIETLEVLSIPGMAESIRKAKKDIKAGRFYSCKEVFGR